MTDTQNPAPSSRWNWFPWAIVAGMGVTILVNGVLIWIALTSFPGEATKDPYTMGMNYNRILDRAEQQTALGWQSSGAILDRLITIAFRDRDGKPLDGLNITGALVRPPGSLAATPLHFTPLAQGRYQAQEQVSSPGRWDVQLSVHNGEGALVYGTTHRLMAK